MPPSLHGAISGPDFGIARAACRAADVAAMHGTMNEHMESTALAFRESLPAVLEWLRILQRTDSQNELCEDLISLIRKMIRYDPNQRIKAETAYEILLRNTDNKHLLFCRDH